MSKTRQSSHIIPPAITDKLLIVCSAKGHVLQISPELSQALEYQNDEIGSIHIENIDPKWESRQLGDKEESIFLKTKSGCTAEYRYKTIAHQHAEGPVKIYLLSEPEEKGTSTSKGTSTKPDIPEGAMQRALELSAYGLFRYHKQKKTIELNDQLAEKLSVGKKQISEQQWHSYIHPEDRDSYTEHHGKTTGQAYGIDYRLKKGENYVWVREWGTKSGEEKKAPYYCRIEDIDEQKRYQMAIETLSKETRGLSGLDYLKELGAQLRELMGMKMAGVGRYLPGETPRSELVSFWMGDQYITNFVYELKGTPCDMVVGKETVLYKEKVQERFPEDKDLQDMNVESYWAAPFFGHDGRPTGHILVMDDKATEHRYWKERILRLYSQRAGLELERMEQLKALQANNDKLENILNSIPDIIVFKDKNGRIEGCNQAFNEMVDKSNEEIIGMTDLEVIPGRLDPEEFNEDLKKVLKTQKPLTREIQIESPNGKQTIELIRTPYFNKEGELEGVVGTGRDISLRKRIETNLREAKELYEKFINASPDTVTVTDMQGNITFISDRGLSLFDIKSKEQVIGKNVLQFIHPDDHEKAKHNIQKTLNSKKKDKIANNQYRLINLDRVKEFIGEINSDVLLDSKNQPRGMIAITRDISNSISMETALKESRDKYAHLMNNSSDLICELDSAGNYTYVNYQYQRILNLKSTEELIGLSGFERIHPDDQAWTFRVFSEGMQQMKPVSATSQYRNGNDEWIWLESRASFYKDSRGDLYSVVISRDVSAAKELEEKLTTAKQKSDEANQAKSQFMANMSHEIRTPLNAIIGFSEILKEKHDADSPHLSYLNGIIKSGNSLLTLINDILDLSKIEAGKLSIEKKSTDVPELLEEIRSILSLKAKNKDLKLRLNIPASMPGYIVTDGARLRQVMFNLVGNSIKFTEEGLVEISLSTKILDKDYCSLSISVKDTGMGIPKEKLNDIFRPFHQLENANTRNFGGTGLGLTITKRLAHSLGGEILVESTLGKGSNFTLVLPKLKYIKQTEGNEPEQSTYNEKIRITGGTILLVEDMESNREVIKGYLENMPVSIIEAGNGRDGVKLAQKHQPDVILMDLQMPVMDGYRAIELLGKNPELKDIPIIVLTASAMESEHKQVKEKVNCYLRKPVKRQEILEELSKHLPHERKKQANRKIGSLQEQMKEFESNKAFAKLLEEELMPMCRLAKKSSNIKAISEFANNLNEAAEKHNIQALVEFADKLKRDIHAYNFSEINNSLLEFNKLM